MISDDLLTCLACRAGALAPAGALLRCGTCGAGVPVVDGIVDFVSGRVATALDVAHYDQVYLVDDDKVALHHCLLGQRLGGLLERPYERALELGAGTGLLTAGLVHRGNVGKLVVTDISSEMLRRCRQRLTRLCPESRTRITYATNDGVHLGVRDGSMDLIVAYFAIHHMLDTEACLRSLAKALADDGVVVLVEPCFRFHAALHATLGPVVEKMVLHPENWDYRDIVSTLTAHQEWGLTLRYGDEQAFVERREDKRFFDRRRFVQMAERAGLGASLVLPFGEDNEPLAAVRAYAAQLPLTETGRELLVQALSAEMPGAFALLDPLDARASYAFVLAKRPESLPALSAPRSTIPTRPSLVPGTEHPLYDIDVGLSPDGACTVGGWAVAMRPVRALRFEGHGSVLRIPVGAARPDVLRLLCRWGTYPRDALLFSGLLGPSDPGARPAWAPGSVLRLVAELEGTGDVLLTDDAVLDARPGGTALRLCRMS